MFLYTRRYTLAALFLGASTMPVLADRITVFAAASLGGALDEVAAAFESDTGHEVALSFAGSSVLARQITLGAPADVFLSANADWMDAVEAAELLADGSRRDFAGNVLVLIAPAEQEAPTSLPETPEEFAAALDGGRLSMALVDAIPAGQYGKAALTHLGLWDAAKSHVVQTDNVRAALALVALGEARLGVVYATDAQAEPRVRLVAPFPAKTHPQITYPAAAIASGDVATATAFLDYLTGTAGQSILQGHGFLPLPEVPE
ncbi:molybdate ABC transporter substrate-binding protein [Aliiroseovarius sp. S1123]|jgi:molybdate transport system substrate-binding protein|uniref:molybdate ABC transporter substrate-binding protein n=1 Tax=unclassified Aliiroseovarius TaxID=2623558 RepID=UPI001FF50B5B|nr:molybdate ABC transporter substrate-binding protein [Aliiroseovarius sp. S1123]MCK0169629.1 molybdate ABC transporter substrate-binding protein [Aliiroseovarius sp. S1123]